MLATMMRKFMPFVFKFISLYQEATPKVQLHTHTILKVGHSLPNYEKNYSHTLFFKSFNHIPVHWITSRPCELKRCKCIC